jgi:predicted nucleic acid-binding protein
MSSPLAVPSLPSGTEVLLDANVITYALNRRSRECVELLERCTTGDLSGYTTVEVLADVCHRLMLAEAAFKGLIARPNAANLQGKSHVVRQLGDYWQRTIQSCTGALAVLPLDEFRFRRAHPLRVSFGLMTNDSLLLAAADVFGISALATNDTDFDPVPWITLYRPRDVQP